MDLNYIISMAAAVSERSDKVAIFVCLRCRALFSQIDNEESEALTTSGYGEGGGRRRVIRNSETTAFIVYSARVVCTCMYKGCAAVLGICPICLYKRFIWKKAMDAGCLDRFSGRKRHTIYDRFRHCKVDMHINPVSWRLWCVYIQYCWSEGFPPVVIVATSNLRQCPKPANLYTAIHLTWTIIIIL